MGTVYASGMANEDENFYAFRGRWCDHVVMRQDLTHGDFRVAYFIASKISADTQKMWWGVKKISAESGISLATVTGAIDKLNDAGLLIVVKGAKGSHTYSLRMPIDPGMAIYNAQKKARGKTGGRSPRVSKIETG